MIDLNSSEEKQLTFKISVASVAPKDLRATLRIKRQDIEYGFPCQTVKGDIVCNIPSLENVLNAVNDEILNSQLEVIAGDTFLVPYTDRFHIIVKPNIKAELSKIESIEIEKPLEITESKKPSKLAVRLMR